MQNNLYGQNQQPYQHINEQEPKAQARYQDQMKWSTAILMLLLTSLLFFALYYLSKPYYTQVQKGEISQERKNDEEKRTSYLSSHARSWFSCP